jgi:hypothetical protein
MAKRKKTEEDNLIDFIGETISTESCLLAASISLMRAGDIAKISGDSDSLIRIANAWYDLARFLSGDEEDEDKKPPHFGFAALETLDEPGDEPDQGESGIEVRQKHW